MRGKGHGGAVRDRINTAEDCFNGHQSGSIAVVDHLGSNLRIKAINRFGSPLHYGLALRLRDLILCKHGAVVGLGDEVVEFGVDDGAFRFGGLLLSNVDRQQV
ncbi:hypothetical protein V22_10840 [Calycomorphotria hydatis]|uniref:Uncharacterized protein n=1 Tax=Calycomorphotria hydatis TaxID=2528027 RepID=A0A517T659_9PLAN|nr:hypothetical protein V22_10840 [Calycomorphotria hydatis]